MRVITHSRITEAANLHPKCAAALDYWYRLMKRGRYQGFAAIKAAFGGVDKVKHLYVFDIGGNMLRLIAAIHFNTGKVFVREVLTHDEYDRDDWKKRKGIKQ